MQELGRAVGSLKVEVVCRLPCGVQPQTVPPILGGPDEVCPGRRVLSDVGPVNGKPGQPRPRDPAEVACADQDGLAVELVGDDLGVLLPHGCVLGEAAEFTLREALLDLVDDFRSFEEEAGVQHTEQATLPQEKPHLRQLFVDGQTGLTSQQRLCPVQFQPVHQQTRKPEMLPGGWSNKFQNEELLSRQPQRVGESIQSRACSHWLKLISLHFLQATPAAQAQLKT